MKLLLFLTIFSCSVGFAAELKPFEAKYSISRDGKKTGEQTTQLTQLGDNLWQIKDQIIGTNGLASVIGFSRTEITEFTVNEGLFQATKHSMEQKAAFSKKRYDFVWNTAAQIFDITHKDKKSTYVPQQKHIISTHLMPIALAYAACQQQQSIELKVLKNKQPKTYQFKIDTNTPKTAQRVYGEQVKKTTKTWFDESKQCLPIKQIHQNHDEPLIETQLLDFTWL